MSTRGAPAPAGPEFDCEFAQATAVLQEHGQRSVHIGDKRELLRLNPLFSVRYVGSAELDGIHLGWQTTDYGFFPDDQSAYMTDLPELEEAIDEAEQTWDIDTAISLLADYVPALRERLIQLGDGDDSAITPSAAIPTKRVATIRLSSLDGDNPGVYEFSAAQLKTGVPDKSTTSRLFVPPQDLYHHGGPHYQQETGFPRNLRLNMGEIMEDHVMRAVSDNEFDTLVLAGIGAVADSLDTGDATPIKETLQGLPEQTRQLWITPLFPM